MPGRPAVAIVGAGPAGLVIAHLLQREAIPCVVLERHTLADLCQHPKAGLIEYRTVASLQRERIAGPILEFPAENHRCEFRTPRGSVVLDYGALTGGRPHYIYPQHQLVQRLCEALGETGGEIRFGHTVLAVTQASGGAVLSVEGPDGSSYEMQCDAVAGCEGSKSVVAAAMKQAQVSEQCLPVRWLVVIGQGPPLENHTIYAAHPRGFAGHMRRGSAQTRYYLEVAVSETTADWPEQRVREELAVRLGVGDRLDNVPFGDIGLLDLRVRVIEPMQQGRLFLAGDAAHLITPAGGKGMNLAIQDAVELAHGLIDRLGPKNDGQRISAYSRTRLPVIWRTQAFSNWFLRIILTSLRDGEEPAGVLSGGFGHGLGQGWVTALQHDPLLARWFAHAYAGVDPRA
jgi:p-hydroxybenzoate 3-monooxygenase